MDDGTARDATGRRDLREGTMSDENDEGQAEGEADGPMTLERALAMIAELQEQLEAATTERDDYLTELAEMPDVRGELQGLKAAQVLNRVLDEKGVKPEFRAGALALLRDGYQGEGDDASIQAHVAGKAKELAPYLTSADRPSRLPRGEGSARGGPIAGTDGKLRVTMAQLSDMAFMDKHGAQIGSGNFEITDVDQGGY